MGLDAVELVLRTEEFFVISIEDDEAGSARTVGDLYNLVCAKLGLPPLQSPVTSASLPVVTEKERVFLFLKKQMPPCPGRCSSLVTTERLGLTCCCDR